MKKCFFILSMLIFLSFSSYSQVVVFSETPEAADVRVFVTQEEGEADLKLFRCASADQVKGNKGLWFFTREQEEATKTVHFVQDVNEADFIVRFVMTKEEAGWVNEEYKEMLD